MERRVEIAAVMAVAALAFGACGGRGDLDHGVDRGGVDVHHDVDHHDGAAAGRV